MIGTVVAIVVLPTPQRVLVEAAASGYLDSLAALVRGACRQLISGDASDELAKETGGLEQRANALRARAPAQPGQLVVRSGRGSLQRSVRLLLSGDHRARELARESRRSHPPLSHDDLIDRVRRAGEQVAQNAKSAAALVAGGEGSIRPAGELVETAVDAAATASDDRLGDALRSAAAGARQQRGNATWQRIGR
ncbi:MAG TPA: hypothetical protein VGF81_12625 [Solirubrobacteraceae bacterium]